MKRILACVLSLALLLGCVSFASAEDATTVRMLWWGSQTRHDVTVAAVNKFMEKHPEIKVEVEYTDWNGYWSKLATQVAGNVAPDVVAMDYAYLTRYAKEGVLADLSPYFESGVIDITNMADSVIGSGMVDGVPYGISTGTNANMLMYRPDVLEAAGLTMPESITWEELFEMCGVVYEKTGRTTVWPSSSEFLRSTARNFGGNLYNDEGTALGFDDPQLIVRIWQSYLDAINAGWALGVGETTAATAFDDCVADSWFGLHWTNELTAYESGNGCELKMVPWPDWSDAQQTAEYFKPSMFWSITESSQVKDAAAVLVNFFENDPDCFDIIALDRAMPISSAIREHIAPNLDENSLEIAAMLDWLGGEGRTSPIMKPDIAANSDVGTLWTEYTEQVQYGMVDADKLLEHAQAFMDEANATIAKSLAE